MSQPDLIPPINGNLLLLQVVRIAAMSSLPSAIAGVAAVSLAPLAVDV